MVDHYSILEVPRNASASHIKKTYKKLALKWHPDKNLNCVDVATKRFNEISEAYEVLSDEEKRRIYDQTYGKECSAASSTAKKGHSYTFKDPFDIFDQFFGRYGEFFFKINST